MALPDRQSEEHDDPFYWGSRYVYVEKNGRRQLTEVPLTRDDILDPQEGDMMSHGPRHYWTILQLAERLSRWLKPKDMTVLADVKILWGIAGLPDPAPDVSVIPGFRDPALLRGGSFSVPEQGDRPCLVIEVISPRYQAIDKQDKVKLYHRAGVQEYLIVDLMQDPIELIGYRRGRDGRYYKNRSRSRWLSKTTQLWFLVGSEPLEILLEDDTTGERLLSAEEETRLRKGAETRFAKIAMLRQAEILAREEAEERAQELEQRAQELEQRADREAEARQALEKELERLRRELERR